MKPFLDVYGDVEMRALWWKQPYCSMMLHGKVETRTWDTKYRGWVLMVCSKAGYNLTQLKNTAGITQMNRIRETLNGGCLHLNELAIAVGFLTGTQPMSSFDEDETYVKYKPDVPLYCHLYEKVHAIEAFKPYPKGQVGWKTVDLSVKEQIILL